jgi:hypothetical protein
MAVLGTNGKIVLNRSAPAPVAVDVTALNQDKNIISLTAQGFRSGDLVEVASIDNWPNADLADSPLIPTYANVYDYQDYAEMVGYSTAYPAELLRPFCWLATEGNDVLTTEDGNVFAVQSDADTTPYRNRLYVHVDQLNRLSFYRTRAAALVGANDATRENINRSAFMARATGNYAYTLPPSDYSSAAVVDDPLETTSLKSADIVGTAGSLSDYPPPYNDSSLAAGTTAYDNANVAPRSEIIQPAYQQPAPDALVELRLVNEWKLEACLQSWSLNLNASEIDTTGLGDQFFDGVKSLVQGGGTFDFLIEREARDTRNTAIISRSEYNNARCFIGVSENTTYNDADITGTAGSIADYGPDYDDASLNPGATAYDNADITPRASVGEYDYEPWQLASVGTSNLLRLLLNTSEQSEAEAEFWMIDGDAQDRTSYTGMLLPGDLYYKAQVMLTSSAVSVRATDIITGSANFVTVREVQLREG